MSSAAATQCRDSMQISSESWAKVGFFLDNTSLGIWARVFEFLCFMRKFVRSTMALHLPRLRRLYIHNQPRSNIDNIGGSHMEGATSVAYEGQDRVLSGQAGETISAPGSAFSHASAQSACCVTTMDSGCIPRAVRLSSMPSTAAHFF